MDGILCVIFWIVLSLNQSFQGIIMTLKILIFFILFTRLNDSTDLVKHRKYLVMWILLGFAFVFFLLMILCWIFN